MANKDYEYTEVKQGRGTYRYESPTQYSRGVQTMQGQLKLCGYAIADDGHFGSATCLAVRRFQQTINGLNDSQVDGIAGKNTLTQLDAVAGTSAFQYGASMSDSAIYWKRSSLANHSFWPNTRDKTIDALARVIYAEDNFSNDARAAIATVIKNRSISNSHTFRLQSATNKWYGVLAANGQYSTVPATAYILDASDSFDLWPSSNNGKRTLVPRRGKTASPYIDSVWSNAVELAIKLYDGQTIVTAKGYPITVNGTHITIGSSKTASLTNAHLNQIGWTKLIEWVNMGHNMTSILNYTGESSGNVFLIR